jgi:hypothetical protein
MPSIASRQQVLPGFRLSLGCALVLLPGNVNVLHRRVHGAWADRGRQSLADAPRDEAMAFMRTVNRRRWSTLRAMSWVLSGRMRCDGNDSCH